jgi:periplasmic divalent cation tolerance protein
MTMLAPAMSDLRLVLTTLDGTVDADGFARALVDEGLAACVNVLPEMRSVYRWQGRVETTTERQLVIKTADTHLDRLKARLASLHPYEVPELLVLPVLDASPEYRAWVLQSLA